MTPTAARRSPTASRRTSQFPSPFWIVIAAPSRATTCCAISAAHVVPCVFTQMTATSAGGSPSRSGAFVRSTMRTSARPSRARSMTWPIAPYPTMATRTVSAPLRGRPRLLDGLRSGEPLTELVELLLFHREGVVRVGERSGTHLLVECAERVGHLRANVAVATENVVEHEHLTVAVGTSADADRRD